MVQKIHQSGSRRKETGEKERLCFHCGYETGDAEGLCVVCGVQLDSDVWGEAGNPEEPSVSL